MPNKTKMKELRFYKDISQWQIAIETGMSQTRVSLIERGLIHPTDIDRLKIARALKCKPEELFSMEAK